MWIEASKLPLPSDLYLASKRAGWPQTEEPLFLRSTLSVYRYLCKLTTHSQLLDTKERPLDSSLFPHPQLQLIRLARIASPLGYQASTEAGEL